MLATVTKVLIVEDERFTCRAYVNALKEIALEEPRYRSAITICTIYEQAKKKIVESTQNGPPYDLAILDMRLPSQKGIINEYGMELAQKLRKSTPQTKIIIITSLQNNHLFYTITRHIRPEGFLLKNEIEPERFKLDLLLILQNKLAYSKSIMEFLRNEAGNDLPLDEIDREILYRLSKGVPTKDLPNYIPLSISGVERRKRRLFILFDLGESKNSLLIMAARDRGII